jgi:2-oxoglutarate dehydrogenase E1 component
MSQWRGFGGVNEGYVLELFERWQQDPSSVDEATRAAFEQAPPDFEDDAPADRAEALSHTSPPVGQGFSPALGQTPSPAHLKKIVGAVTLAESIRKYGHLGAQLDPLGTPPWGDPSLAAEAHGIGDSDLRQLPASLVGGPAAAAAGNAFEAISALRRVYSSKIGYDLAHIFRPEERAWLRQVIEAGTFRAPADPVDHAELLDRITEVETFERFLHKTFPGKTRFSVEGLDMLVPVLDEIIADSADAGVTHVFIGMAHRGRLNVLAHVLQKSHAQILAEFKESLGDQPFREDLGWTGDVKYHSGARVSVKGGGELVISMPPNPSHLEFVDPVVVGMARAASTDAGKGGAPSVNAGRTLPILIHGDAAFPGQGIVAETLNLALLPGYNVGGTVHVIANNQLGFTATGKQSYSTSYASGMARGFKIPILHVNADDVEACIEAARLAAAYRARFQRDVLIDLVGYRRHGHNEGDEASFTQPVMYRAIPAHPTVREIWAKSLADRGIALTESPEALVARYTAELEKALEDAQRNSQRFLQYPEPPPRGTARHASTAVPLERLRALAGSLLEVPDGFTVHRKLERIRDKRKAALDDPAAATVDWSVAEELAFASILEDGISIRLTGEDVERGTFSHRHAVLHDYETGRRYTALQRIPQAQAAFEIHNSPLTESATVGFEFGYNVQEPARLVIWEGQYGDFVNGAQVIIDEFLTSGRAKWGLTPSLVLLLPHGYEGQGPDHSSARPERFLEAAADLNLRVANCTTAAQYFHLLRRQAALLLTDPLPLVVLTPKSPLRHPLVASPGADLAEGRWQPVLPDPGVRAGQVRRVVLCSGKVAVDLVSSEMRAKSPEVAVVRVEQLYPFPWDDLKPVLEGYPRLAEVVWLQEEPENMGAWEFVRPLLEEGFDERWPLRYVGRARSASPAEGSMAWHAANQKTLLAEAFETGSAKGRKTMVLSKKV